MPSIIAVDPGGTTGVAIYSQDTGDLRQLEIEGGRFGFYPLWSDLVKLAAEPFVKGGHLIMPGEDLISIRAVHVVCENFIVNTTTAKKSRQADPLMIAGFLEGDCAVRGGKFTLQTPAQAKAFASDDKLHHLGWYHPTKGGHANDATRHLLVYLATGLRDDKVLMNLSQMLP